MRRADPRSFAELARAAGMPEATLRKRVLRLGWPLERALTVTRDRHKSPIAYRCTECDGVGHQARSCPTLREVRR